MKKVKEQHKKVHHNIQPRKNISSAGEVLMPCPLSLTATSGDSEGEIDLVWEPVEKAHTYVVQKCKDSKGPAKWVNEDIVSKSSYTVSNLKSSRKYRFRVAAVGRIGQGPWSELVQKKAP
jgi:hypothetical protein